MIFYKIVIITLVCVVWSERISGKSYSQVYVNSGSDGVPYQYAKYGTPAVAYGPPVAQLTSDQSGPRVSSTQNSYYLPPCPAPCIPTQQVLPVATTGLIAYKAPIVVGKDEPPTPYQYSYVVYDDNTGDQKTQKELSNNGVVRGQYSFLQPDGYVRQVQYTVDDATGFKAIVNYLLPDGVVVDAKQTKNCDEPKSEALKKSEKPKVEASSEVKDVSSKIINSKIESLDFQPEKPTATGEKKDAPTPNSKTKNIRKDEPSSASPRPPLQIVGQGKEDIPTGNSVETTAVVIPIPSPQLPPSSVPTSAVPTGYFSYEQLLKCLQKIQQLKYDSPLTYILLPSKPC